MSFSLPITDYRQGCACFLPPDAPIAESVGQWTAASPSDNRRPPLPLYALWGGSAYCTDLLLGAIADETANRSLHCFNYFALEAPTQRQALWVEGIGLFFQADSQIPSGAKLIDLSPLRSDAPQRAVHPRKAVLLERCKEAGTAIMQTEKLELALAQPFYHSLQLQKKASRIAAKVKAGKGKKVRLSITAYHKGGVIRRLPFDGEVEIVGLGELYGVATRFLTLLDGELAAKNADRVLLTDGWSGSTVGLWLPEEKRCYLLSCSKSEAPFKGEAAPQDETSPQGEKQMSLSRFLNSRPQAVRSEYRSLEGCRKEFRRHLASLSLELAEVEAEERKIEEENLKKSRFGAFRKRLLIDLFCK